MLRFVVLEHRFPAAHARQLHWDLMLEAPSGLLTWALSAEPARKIEIPAEQLPSHRLEYLEYQGPVSGDRGTVNRWDGGQFRWVIHEPDRAELELAGERLCGRATLERVPDAPHRWVFTWLEA